MVVCNFVIPFPMLCLRRVRRSVPALCFASFLVVVGMYAERLLIVVPVAGATQRSVHLEQLLPSWVELSILAAALAHVSSALHRLREHVPDRGDQRRAGAGSSCRRSGP
jgi:hypothetical protein